jgi:hypothetical protein
MVMLSRHAFDKLRMTIFLYSVEMWNKHHSNFAECQIVDLIYSVCWQLMINWFSVLSHIKTIYVSEPGQSEMQAKSEAARQGKWLLVNLQSTREFSSYMVSMDPVLT